MISQMAMFLDRLFTFAPSRRLQRFYTASKPTHLD